MSHITIKRGRKPGSGVHRWKPTTMKMNDFKFNPELFVPMKTNKRIDNLLYFPFKRQSISLILIHRPFKSICS